MHCSICLRCTVYCNHKSFAAIHFEIAPHLHFSSGVFAYCDVRMRLCIHVSLMHTTKIRWHSRVLRHWNCSFGSLGSFLHLFWCTRFDFNWFVNQRCVYYRHTFNMWLPRYEWLDWTMNTLEVFMGVCVLISSTWTTSNLTYADNYQIYY